MYTFSGAAPAAPSLREDGFSDRRCPLRFSCSTVNCSRASGDDTFVGSFHSQSLSPMDFVLNDHVGVDELVLEQAGMESNLAEDSTRLANTSHTSSPAKVKSIS